MPYVSQVAIGRLPELKIFGNNYDTPDGTCVRDYIHVSDVASGHICALKNFEEKPGLSLYNLGTGQGFSVLEIVKTFEKIYKLVPMLIYMSQIKLFESKRLKSIKIVFLFLL